MLDVWVGKMTQVALRVARRGGTTLPGRIARRVSPYVLLRLASHVPVRVVVSGTNGKTTTCRLTAEACRQAGRRLVHNRSGANLAAGVTTAFLASAGWDGSVAADIALLEVDEAALPALVPELRPGILAVTNFFRDQLDRYGEVDRTVAHVERAARAMGPGRTLLLNADDPLAVALAERLGGAEFFGVHAMRSLAEGRVVDVTRCPRCGGPLAYRAHTVGHLGDFRCPDCGLARPEPVAEVLTYQATAGGQHLTLRVEGEERQLTVPLPGLYNAYNIVLAALLARRLGVGEAFDQAAEAFRTSFGRMERLVVGGRPVVLALVKNPAGFDEALATFLEADATTALFLINDRDADGRDVSWLWDVDVEALTGKVGVGPLVTGGTRGPDMAVRLKYAGLGDVVQPGEGVEGPLSQALRQGSGDLFIFVTYTALLELRGLLTERGEAEAFWQE